MPIHVEYLFESRLLLKKVKASWRAMSAFQIDNLDLKATDYR